MRDYRLVPGGGRRPKPAGPPAGGGLNASSRLPNDGYIQTRADRDTCPHISLPPCCHATARSQTHRSAKQRNRQTGIKQLHSYSVCMGFYIYIEHVCVCGGGASRRRVRVKAPSAVLSSTRPLPRHHSRRSGTCRANSTEARRAGRADRGSCKPPSHRRQTQRCTSRGGPPHG